MEFLTNANFQICIKTLEEVITQSSGTRSFIEGMLKKIKDLGVEIITDVKKASFNPCASEIYFVDEKIGNYTIKYDTLISGLGAVGLAKLRIRTYGVWADRPLPHTMFHLAMSKPAQADCFYFYGFESKSSIYRVTNYDAFCPRPPEALSRITIEVLGALESNNTLECILEELENLGVIEIKNIKFSATEKYQAVFLLQLLEICGNAETGGSPNRYPSEEHSPWWCCHGTDNFFRTRSYRICTR